MSPRTLSESESKQLLAGFGVPMAGERRVADADEAVAAAQALGFPVVAKLNGDAIAHKTERGLVKLNLRDEAAVRVAATELLAAATPDDGAVDVLVAPMIRGNRELIAGVLRDPQFGPTVMLGLGGILAEAVADVVFRPAPVDLVTAHEMIDQLATQRLLGEFRGEAAVDRDALAAVLVGLGQVAGREDIESVDVNPLIVGADGVPIAVDALVEQREVPAGGSPPSLSRPAPTPQQFRALFEPRACSSPAPRRIPASSGSSSCTTSWPAATRARSTAPTCRARSCSTSPRSRMSSELPPDSIDLVVVCTPSSANVALLRACAAKGATAAFVTSAGYGEAGEAGRRAEAELVAVCDELGILLAGPNGQGVVSTPVKLCAQMVAPFPPAGRIGIASQSGNFVSSFLNLSRASGVGVSRAVSAGNAAAVSVADYLDHYADDDATAVALAYVEGINDGRVLLERFGQAAARKPLVLVKGGATEGGARAAASHTGALAADDKVFDGACRAAGITRATTIEEAFEAAATFATQPLPPGPNVVVLTTAGGWGVVTADAITAIRDLQLLVLPDDLRDAIDALLPPRWSHNNPVDCAGGETRDTIPEVMRLLAEHDPVHAVVYLGIGIQSNQARMMRAGRFYPGYGLERIVAYHERQDARFAEAADELSRATTKPILTATELAFADPDNAGPAAVRASGRLCYPSGNRAVTALGHLYRYARHRARRRG